MGKVNLVGQRFGKLVVEREATPEEHAGRPTRTSYWFCRCDCGNTKVVSRVHLTRKDKPTKSCGCLIEENASLANIMRQEDLTGNVYNDLTVLGRHIWQTENQTYNYDWECECRCGNITYVSTADLKSGKVKSCGCRKMLPKHEDLTGQKFGMLTAIKYIRNNNQGNAIWEWECDCGNHKIVAAGHVKAGKTLSCGCLKSKGEMKIAQLLTDANIPFQREYVVHTSDGNIKRFDFFVDDKYLIEYDGEQHFQISNPWYRPEADELKEQWCKDNNIPLIRIPYTKFDTLTIDDLLLEAE